MASKDIPKTAFVTPFGMFEFLCLHFGLRNAGKTFLIMMSQILGNLPYCVVYIEFGVPETQFLGHCLMSFGLSPLLKQTSAFRDFPLPSDKPGLQQDPGMINFFQRFLCNTAQVLAPFTNTLKGPG